MTRKERFEKAKKAREEAKKKENQKFDLPDLVPIEYLPMEKDRFTLFRIASAAIETRQKPSDGFKIKQSMMRGDDKKYFNVVWSYQRDWPLNQLYYFITKGKYDDSTQTKTYDYNGCELLTEVLTNGQIGNRFATGWKPQELALLNVIDRLDMDFHRDNKVTKVFTKDANKSDEGRFYTSYGISKKGLYEKILGVYDENMVHHSDTDIAVRRLSEKKGDNWYLPYLPEFDSRKIEPYCDMDGINYLDYYSDKALTEEELSWDRVDFETDPRYKVTSTIKIYNRLKKFIDKVDKKYDTDFSTIFKDQVEHEKAEFNAMMKEQEKNNKKSTPVEKTLPSKKEEEVSNEKEDTTVESVEKTPRRSRKSASKEFGSNDVPEKYRDSYTKLSEEDKEFIVGFDSEKDEYIFPEGEGLLPCEVEDGGCGSNFSENMMVCPYCGIEWED